MIPLHLRISGFLSYRDPVELDFNSFELACISGQNGAGKSALLDSITWALFGQARKRDESLINVATAKEDNGKAEILFSFIYEKNIYRIQRILHAPVVRTKSRTNEPEIIRKPAILEFHVFHAQSPIDYGWPYSRITLNGEWKPFTEKTTRETQERIEQTLKLDYETFINASFFLQGKADQFTQKNPSERKAVLSNILGLEIWDTYKDRTAEKRKFLESEIQGIDGRVAEIDTELGEEDGRRTRLLELENTLKQLSSTRVTQETILENIRKNAALLNEQRKLAETHLTSLERSRSSLAGLEVRFAEKESDRARYANLISRTQEIESAYKDWQKARKGLEELDQVAMEFREHAEHRQPLLREIEVEKAKLEQEHGALSNQLAVISEQLSVSSDLEEQIKVAQKSLREVEAKIEERGELESQRNESREKYAALKVENESLRREMDETKKRIDSLEDARGATCPLCGQELSDAHRKSTLKELNKTGKDKGDQFRANKKELDDIEKQIAGLEAQIAKFANAENERVKHSNMISQLTERIETLQAAEKEWEKSGKKRLAEVGKILDKESFAVEARKQLAKLDKELAKLGYDAAAHEVARRTEANGRSAEEEFSNLKSAREGNKQTESEIANLNSEIANRKSEIGNLEADYQTAKINLESAEAQSPDLNKVERELFTLREDENRTRDQVGAARQKVDVLATLRTRKTDYSNQREELNQQIVRHKTLERAFGKDGVPALLIEQALPQIEEKANNLLGKLSNDRMSIKFNTLEKYKDDKRKDKKETLEITITDGAGPRDYEMYSGGEAFRVNFAIRLALSEILAQRKGARLQTLVIDEGFGSQDAQGIQNLKQAIIAIKKDFEKILIITHLDELKDAFPNRIEVEKTERGSTVKVI